MAIAGYLKQSTAATIVLGPFVDSTDGVTPKTTGISVTQAAVRVSKNAGAFGQKNDSSGGTHMENGYYSVPLNATDTNTTGRLVVAANINTTLPVRQDYVVLRSDEFDALFDTTTGRGLRGILTTGTAQSATSTTVVLAAGETFGDSTLVGATIAVYGATQNYWQVRTVTAYTSSTKTATVDTWSVTPSGTLTYLVFVGAPASASAPITANITQIAGQTASASGTVTFPTGTVASTTNITGGTIANVTTVNGLAANVVTAASLAADAGTEIAAAVLSAAITTPIAANVKQINSATVVGDGTSGNKWRGQ